VALLHRRQAEGLVLHGVVLGADPKEAAVEQADGARADVVEAHVVALDLRLDALAQRRERPREGEHVVELLLVAAGAPAWVVEVLLAAGGVGAGRLDVAPGVRADPDVLPRRRDHELLDALEYLGVVHAPRAVGLVDEAAPAARAPDARTRAVGAAQAGRTRGSGGGRHGHHALPGVARH
jgi:hypothetical protein